MGEVVQLQSANERVRQAAHDPILRAYCELEIFEETEMVDLEVAAALLDKTTEQMKADLGRTYGLTPDQADDVYRQHIQTLVNLDDRLG